MGDVGYLDERGRIWFCGRKSHRVVTSDGTFFTICCEGVLNAHPQVFRTALVGVDRGAGIEPELCVEIDPELPRRERPDRDGVSAGDSCGELRELGTLATSPARHRAIPRPPRLPGGRAAQREDFPQQPWRCGRGSGRDRPITSPLA